MTRMVKSPAMCLAVCLALASIARPVRGETPLHRSVEVNFDGVSVESALATLGERADVQFEYDADLVRGLHSVTYKAEDQEAGRIAMRILYPRGLELGEVRGNRVRIVKRDPFDEVRPRREENFEFARKPEISRDGDRVTISFETAGWCDVTIAIEDDRGTIIRHLASGVLGPNAPEPFQWNTKDQRVVWDGKDDKGEYVDDKDIVTVRVSLGLKPRFERTLYWAPERQFGGTQALAPTSEGMLVYNSGTGFDHLRLFDEEGRYVRTLHPFPSGKIEEIPGVAWQNLPDGVRIPVKPNMYQSTFLQSGSFVIDYCEQAEQYRGRGSSYPGKSGWGGETLAVARNRIALTGVGVSRLGLDGGSDGLPLHGPDVGQLLEEDDVISFRVSPRHGRSAEMVYREAVTPKRAALSPDGETLYLTRDMEYTHSGWGPATRWRGHAVRRLAFVNGNEPEPFLGGEVGDDNGQFNMPSDVATDAEGRIYVADHGNDRVQVFSPEGEWLRNIDIPHPSDISVSRRTGEIYVFCWPLPRPDRGYSTGGIGRFHAAKPLPDYGDLPSSHVRLHIFSALDEGAEPMAAWPMLVQGNAFMNGRGGYGYYRGAVDDRNDPPTVWLAPGEDSDPRNFVVLREKNGQLEEVRHFHRETVRAVRRAWNPAAMRQRLYVNPVDGTLYVGAIRFAGGRVCFKSINELIRIDAETGRYRTLDLPFTTKCMAFDRDGHVYLRSADMIVRYDPETWREVPFDYGEERPAVASGGGSLSRSAEVISGAVFPGNRGWHQGGMHVNAHGDIVIGALYEVNPASRHDETTLHKGERFEPSMYPGRRYDPGGRFGGMMVHVIDRHGQMLHADAVPGLLSVMSGVALDADRNVYLLAHRTRAFDGEAGWNPLSGTLMRFTPGQNRILSAFGAPVPMGTPPARHPDLLYGRARGQTWVEGAHWFYGGGGWGAGNTPASSTCTCHATRFTLDYYARSFTPEVERYNVGVVDSAGNLMVRVGQYGNVDDGKPLVKDGGPPNPRSIGGDEVALFHPAYVATHTDRRLFIADSGNARIASVKLGYHTGETVALKDVPDAGDPAK